MTRTMIPTLDRFVEPELQHTQSVGPRIPRDYRSRLRATCDDESGSKPRPSSHEPVRKGVVAHLSPLFSRRTRRAAVGRPESGTTSADRLDLIAGENRIWFTLAEGVRCGCGLQIAR